MVADPDLEKRPAAEPSRAPEATRAHGIGRGKAPGPLAGVGRALRDGWRRLLGGAGRGASSPRRSEGRSVASSGSSPLARTGGPREPRLVRDASGREACVACFLCETICPARCIRIVAEPSPWPDRERRPAAFEVDVLRCVSCGLCEEVCPEGAIVVGGAEASGLRGAACPGDGAPGAVRLSRREGVLVLEDLLPPVRKEGPR